MFYNLSTKCHDLNHTSLRTTKRWKFGVRKLLAFTSVVTEDLTNLLLLLSPSIGVSLSLLFQKPHRSCAEVKQADPGADSGYYWIKIKDRELQVYCDMQNYGEFWIIEAAVTEFNYT